MSVMIHARGTLRLMSRSDELVAAWRALLLAQNAVLRAIDEDLAAAGGVPIHVYDVLLELNAAPHRRLRMKDLASRTVLTRSRISKLVDELAADGFVERHADASDGRGSFVVITSTGRAALRRSAPIYLESIDRHFMSHLLAGEAERLTAALERVVAGHQPRITTRASR
jgi:DNA-binding MarR family transcriptional regulator